jgi:hypothetical protein
METSTTVKFAFTLDRAVVDQIPFSTDVSAPEKRQWRKAHA